VRAHAFVCLCACLRAQQVGGDCAYVCGCLCVCVCVCVRERERVCVCVCGIKESVKG